ncbi:hypothetical protein LX36DRAFT_704139 [Colletotrichum falcatum]|nr:hypothetical protein LX36DRAFT_704139 [Colletotrichum falcatum]
MPAAENLHKCPEKRCAAALTTKSNLKRHMRKHRPKVQMPCGKELRDHPTNNARHQKKCFNCQIAQAAEARGSVVAEASGDTRPAGAPSDGSAFPNQYTLHPAVPEPHTTHQYATLEDHELDCFAFIDPKTQVRERSPADWPVDPGAGTGDGSQRS